MEEKEIREETVEEVVDEETEEVVTDINEEDRIKELEDEIAKLKNDYFKAYADTENLKKRLNKEAEDIRKYRIQSFALDILPVVDNLERALGQSVPEGAEGFYKGVEMIYNQFVSALKREGVEEIECLDTKFDPNLEQAIMKEKVEGVEPDTVVAVLQKGYKLKDRILRPSMVKVSE